MLDLSCTEPCCLPVTPAKPLFPRPDMRDYFRARIDFHVNGMRSTMRQIRPRGVERILGDVTDYLIVVTMVDGTRYTWTGGQYASRKVNGCYAPLMPKVSNP